MSPAAMQVFAIKITMTLMMFMTINDVDDKNDDVVDDNDADDDAAGDAIDGNLAGLPALPSHIRRPPPLPETGTSIFQVNSCKINLSSCSDVRPKHGGLLGHAAVHVRPQHCLLT